MRNLFSVESSLMRCLSFMTNMVILNTLFLLFSLPLFTIGASLTSLGTGCQRLLRGEDRQLVSRFVRDFRRNFKQSTYLWLLLFGLASLLVVDSLLLLRQGFVMQYVGFFGIAILAIILLILSSIAFPYIGRYHQSFLEVIKNSIFVALGNPKWLWCILLVDMAVIYYGISSPERLLTAIYVYTFGGCTFVAMLNAYFVKHIFDEVEKRNKKIRGKRTE